MFRTIISVLLSLAALFAQSSAFAIGVPAWVATSNAYTRQVLETDAQFSPEDASQAGLEQYDGLAMDLGPKLTERYIAAEKAQQAKLQAALAKESDPQVKQDLQILIDYIAQSIEGAELSQRLTLDWRDIPELAFNNLNAILDDQVSPKRRQTAKELLERYTGLYRGSTPLTVLAQARWADSQAAARVGPYKGEVKETLGKTDTYVSGIRALFLKYQVRARSQRSLRWTGNCTTTPPGRRRQCCRKRARASACRPSFTPIS